MTVDEAKNQLPSRHKVSLGLDRETSTNKLDITTVIASYRDRNWVFCTVQLAVDEFNHLLFSHFKN